jgi:hypothetical protein
MAVLSRDAQLQNQFSSVEKKYLVDSAEKFSKVSSPVRDEET